MKKNITDIPQTKANTRQGRDRVHEIRSNSPVLLNRKELCILTGFSKTTVRNYEAKGFIPVIKIGRRRIYRLPSVLAALERLEQ